MFVIHGKVILGVSFDLAQFPHTILAYHSNVSDTLSLEKQYAGILDQPITANVLETFIKDVCRWGGYAGIAGKVLKHNSQSHLVTIFEAVRLILHTPTPDLAQALTHLNTIQNLGTPSFASKHLRLMHPQVCPVYDSILNSALPYPFNPAGYQAFAHDCQAIAHLLTEQSILNPTRPDGAWWVADVEAVLFAQCSNMT